jgi:hypothetical protein
MDILTLPEMVGFFYLIFNMSFGYVELDFVFQNCRLWQVIYTSCYLFITLKLQLNPQLTLVIFPKNLLKAFLKSGLQLNFVMYLFEINLKKCAV